MVEITVTALASLLNTSPRPSSGRCSHPEPSWKLVRPDCNRKPPSPRGNSPVFGLSRYSEGSGIGTQVEMLISAPH